jgi:hypothetical protein
MSDPVATEPPSLSQEKPLTLEHSEVEAFRRFLVNRHFADKNKREIQAKKFLQVYAKHGAS